MFKIMTPKNFLLTSIPAIIIAMILNGVFHAVIAAPFFNKELAVISCAAKPIEETNPALLLLVETIWVSVLTYFLIHQSPPQLAWREAAFAGALINLVAAGTWNFINAAMIPWSFMLVLVDLPWHLLVGAVAGASISLIYNTLNKEKIKHI